MDREQFLERTWPWLRRLAAVAAWLALAATLVAWALLAVADRHWLGTLMAFGPRWVLFLPVTIAAIFAAFWRPRSLWPVAIAAAVVAGPVMGLGVPWRTWALQSVGNRQRLRVLTCNVAGGRHNVASLLSQVHQYQPQIVALQEYPPERQWPAELGPGWHVARRGGLLVASRFPITHSSYLHSPVDRWRDPALRCELETPGGPLALVTVHLMTPRPGLEAVLHSRWEGIGELDEVTRLRAAEILAVRQWIGEPSGPLVVAGDFNMPQESTIYRQRFGTLTNALGTTTWGYGWTKFTRSFGVRIDHILCGGPLEVRGSRVLRDIGSDHRPVVADLCEATR